jgi:hypothetical protein
VPLQLLPPGGIELQRATLLELQRPAPAPPHLLLGLELKRLAPPPRFDPGEYAEDDDIPVIAAKLEMAAPALTTGDFVPSVAPRGRCDEHNNKF